MNFEEIYGQVKDLKGWMGEEDCLALYEHTKDLKNSLIVEIGSFMGISTKVMALSSPTSKVIAIDPYLTVHPSSGLSNPRYVKKEFLKATKGLNVELIPDLSENVGKTWQKPIDFLHIDGDHHYNFVIKDINLFVPHVKSDCYVFFHDYTARGQKGEYGIVEAIEKTKEKYFSEVKRVSGFARCRTK